jgi:hypothetical protein
MSHIKGAASNKGPMNRPSYHHALMEPNNQRALRAVAIAWMIKKRILIEASELYTDAIEDDAAA